VPNAAPKICRIPVFATSAERSINLLIEYQCPQCGAPAVLDETDRLFSCQFCKVSSYLIAKDIFRYMLPHAAPKDKKLLFFPYWRFKGLLFSCAAGKVKHKFVDTSSQAVACLHFPASVGLRSQALKLKFVTPETAGRFLKPTLAFDAMMETIMARFDRTMPGEVNHHEHIGETISLIYSPFYLDKKVFDAVLNQPVAELPDDFSAQTLKGGPPNWKIDFLPTLCPACGWDLSGERDSLILVCTNCHSVWMPRKRKLKQINFAHFPDAGEDLYYLPFWRIRAKISGMQLDSYADLVKTANLPLAMQPQFHEREFRFWALGFKVTPQLFVRLASNMTLSQPQEELVTQLPKGRIHPVTLPLTEALESLKIILAGFVKPAQPFFPRLPEIQIKPTSFLLVYVPFHEHHHEFIQPKYRLTVNKNMLTMSKNL
jgi:predicted RNA-binding Zn-ribbon protein involved in translation (DUF1610 family)